MLQSGTELSMRPRETLQQREQAGVLVSHRESFAECEAFFAEMPLTADNLTAQEQAFRTARQKECEALKESMKPHELELSRLMNGYLREFREEEADLGADLSYLESFCHRIERIRHDDLPRHETRFKERLNEKVILRRFREVIRGCSPKMVQLLYRRSPFGCLTKCAGRMVTMSHHAYCCEETLSNLSSLVPS